MRASVARAAVLCALAAVMVWVGLARQARAAGGGGERTVVLYSSVDDFILRDLIKAFEAESGIKVRVVGDTEATKTTGLVERLLAEKDHPRADVWWSNEPFGTIRLAREGVLEAYTSPAEASIPGGWPAAYRGADKTWYGFGLRARTIVYNSKKLKPEQVPRSVAELAQPAWKGRVGLARPQFGTTRGQMGALCAADAAAYRDWVKGLRANRVRLYDGNSAVVKGVALGEIDVGLTDTDDVYGGEREGWPVAMAPLGSPGGLALPNTIGKAKGAPHASEAAALIDFALSERVERMLAESEAHNAPIHPALAKEFARYALPEGARTDFAAIEAKVTEAMSIWDEVFGQ